MTKLLEVYKCNVCGNIVEVLHAGVGELVCCGESMEALEEKTEEQLGEKHVPVVENENDKIKVKVGSVPHPMQEDHFIEWIQVISGDTVLREFLSPSKEPLARFNIDRKNLKTREYCNIHGLWKGDEGAE